jgi:hypothetical protein
MIKMGDRVAPFDDMLKVGTVVALNLEESYQWMAGGAMGALFIAKVKHDDKELVEYRVDKLMRVDD